MKIAEGKNRMREREVFQEIIVYEITDFKKEIK